jgi:hypothetical protein
VTSRVRHESSASTASVAARPAFQSATQSLDSISRGTDQNGWPLSTTPMRRTTACMWPISSLTSYSSHGVGRVACSGVTVAMIAPAWSSAAPSNGLGSNPVMVVLLGARRPCDVDLGQLNP